MQDLKVLWVGQGQWKQVKCFCVFTEIFIPGWGAGPHQAHPHCADGHSSLEGEWKWPWATCWPAAQSCQVLCLHTRTAENLAASHGLPTYSPWKLLRGELCFNLKNIITWHNADNNGDGNDGAGGWWWYNSRLLRVILMEILMVVWEL